MPFDLYFLHILDFPPFSYCSTVLSVLSGLAIFVTLLRQNQQKVYAIVEDFNNGCGAVETTFTNHPFIFKYLVTALSPESKLHEVDPDVFFKRKKLPLDLPSDILQGNSLHKAITPS
jgi:hypothetical protein